jgi:cell division protein ZapE
MTSVSQDYAARVDAGDIGRDPAQEKLALRFDRLLADLARAPAGGSLFGKLFGRRDVAGVKGLYVWGEVGRGKSMLMDIFFDLAPEARKRRVHFHAFMVDVHARVHARRSADAGGRDDPILAVADAIADETRLLCFDEMQVRDIADAMMLARLFGRLFERGTVVVATSNAPPDRLYHKGLNRELFLPFIALLESRLEVVKLEARTDFRQEKQATAPRWHVPANAAARAALDAAFRAYAGTGEGAPETLRVQGRDVVVPQAANGVARFGFDTLCAEARGPADYGAIATHYETVLIDDIPGLDTAPQDVVRRFVILIDELYDRRVRLIASAEAEPDALLTEGRQHWEFQRTASRLTEMRSAEWPQSEFNLPE